MSDFTPKKAPKVDKAFTGRGYPIEAAGGKQFPSVTTILDAISKPGLVPWAVKKERLFVTGVAADLFVQGGTFASREAYIEALTKLLGVEGQHKKAMSDAADIGTVVHAAVENNLREQLGLERSAPKKIPLNDEQKAAARQAYASYLDWKSKSKFRPVEIEKRVYSLEDEFAGTMDGLGEGLFDETFATLSLAVADWKTSAGIYLSACMQTSAYRKAYIEMGLHLLYPGVPGEGLEPIPSTRPLNGLILRLPKTIESPDFEPRFIPEKEMVAYYQAFLATKALFWAIQEYERRYPWKKKRTPKKKAA